MKITKLSPLTWDEAKQVTEVVEKTEYLQLHDRIKDDEHTYTVYVKHEHSADLFHLGKQIH